MPDTPEVDQYEPDTLRRIQDGVVGSTMGPFEILASSLHSLTFSRLQELKDRLQDDIKDQLRRRLEERSEHANNEYTDGRVAEFVELTNCGRRGIFDA
ncbi:hypothetical protein H2199_001673 [Coniosporium tulheliwenetii]|uniref:Uncharacterized protein n=1 Tax=Coniosporium tulheliwenetii TaxID=3383036 RepID=A0ACC2ZK17_9PEZI|nr:hypothetical protein H2199_001673 [Cladosporium sp. JES 115]